MLIYFHLEAKLRHQEDYEIYKQVEINKLQYTGSLWYVLNIKERSRQVMVESLEQGVYHR